MHWPLVLDSDVWLRRSDMRSRRVLDDQAFFDRFPCPASAVSRTQYRELGNDFDSRNS